MPAEPVRVFDQEQVTAMLREALDIVEELDPPEDLRTITFQVALNVIGQHKMPDSPFALPAR